MKFEELLMQREEEHRKKVDLEEEVAELQDVLENQQVLNRILQCAAFCEPPVCHACHSCLSSVLPLQVQELLAELATVEEEIISLERKVEELKVSMCQERKQQKQLSLQLQQQRGPQRWQEQQQMNLQCCVANVNGLGKLKRPRPCYGTAVRCPKLIKERISRESTSEASFTKTNIWEAQKSRGCNDVSAIQTYHDGESIDTPNKLSEEVMKSLISIFCKLHSASNQLDWETAFPKLSISCISSKSFMSKSTFSCKYLNASGDTVQGLDSYGSLLETDGMTRDISSYRKCIQITRASMDMSRSYSCMSDFARLQFLMHTLCKVEPSLLAHKQKLAFWINIYNASIMHAFLQHGVPPSSDKLLTLLNKAAVNVGGIVLNALAIEHFILRHASNIYSGSMDEKVGLWHAYGLEYPEPNIIFALCRGNWSSPALRTYTAEDVVNELERAKVEYLEASICITSKKKIVIPKLLHWHMKDFADDIVSLLEWIYSQLPKSGSLKKSIMECLNGNAKTSMMRMVDIRPLEAEFRYLFPS